MRDLTDKQKRFVEEYLIDLNAAAAARRAGYSEHTDRAIACELMQKESIQDAIAEAQAERSHRTRITQDRVLLELARIGFADIRKLFTWDAERAAFVPSVDISDDDAAAISEIQSESTSCTTEDGVTETKVKLKLKLNDKQTALDKIMRHLGMFEDDGPGKDADELARDLRQAIKKMAEADGLDEGE